LFHLERRSRSDLGQSKGGKARGRNWQALRKGHEKKGDSCCDGEAVWRGGKRNNYKKPEGRKGRPEWQKKRGEVHSGKAPIKKKDRNNFSLKGGLSRLWVISKGGGQKKKTILERLFGRQTETSHRLKKGKNASCTKMKSGRGGGHRNLIKLICSEKKRLTNMDKKSTFKESVKRGRECLREND